MRWLALLAVALALPLAGCSDTTVRIDEVQSLEDVEGLGATVDPEVVRVGSHEAVTGVVVARDRRVPFAIVVGEIPQPAHVTVHGRTYRFVSGCAGAGVYLERGIRGRAAFAIEAATYDRLAPDAYCEG